MILTEEQLSKAMHGWVEKETIDGYTRFFRFTKKQRNHYATTQFNTKENASAGQTMEFITDATAIRFEYTQEIASSQYFYFFDLFINGKMVSHVGKETYVSPEKGIYEEPLSEGEKHVRIVLPNLSQTSLRNVELKNATIFQTVEKKRNYIAYGDSITQGYTAHFPSLSYFNLITEVLDAEGYNLGIGGEFFSTVDAGPKLSHKGRHCNSSLRNQRLEKAFGRRNSPKNADIFTAHCGDPQRCADIHPFAHLAK